MLGDSIVVVRACFERFCLRLFAQQRKKGGVLKLNPSRASAIYERGGIGRVAFTFSRIEYFTPSTIDRASKKVSDWLPSF